MITTLIGAAPQHPVDEDNEEEPAPPRRRGILTVECATRLEVLRLGVLCGDARHARQTRPLIGVLVAKKLKQFDWSTILGIMQIAHTLTMDASPASLVSET